MKVKPYQFGLATISSFQDHLEVTYRRANQNELTNIYLTFFALPIFHHAEANERKHLQVVVNVAIMFENKDTILFTETGFFSIYSGVG